MASKANGGASFDTKLSGSKHEHPLLPIELGHPVTVTPANVPAGLTSENVAIVELPRRFRSLSGNDFPIADWRAAFDVVKDRHGDCYDFVVFFTDPRLPNIPYSGYHRGVYNEVAGINRSSFSSRSAWNSDRLQSQIWMGRFSLGTLLQEVGHRWGAFVRYRMSLGGADQTDLMLSGGGHWAREFDDGDSPMDYDEERHVRIAPNRWRREPIGGFEFRYCPLDLYLMGMMTPREVGIFTQIRNYADLGPLPGGRRLIGGNPRNLRVRNVVWSEGRRIPDRDDSQKVLRAAFVVVTRNENRLDSGFVQQVELLRQQLGSYFTIATHGRACMETSLCCGPTVSRSRTVTMNLKRDRITRSGLIYHGLGPVPAKVEVGFEATIGGRPITSWSREETPDITTGVQHLSVQVARDPYDGRFEIVAQAKGRDLKIEAVWWASRID